MLTYALKKYKTHIDIKYVSSVDGSVLHELLDDLDVETTLFVVASKSFSTQETLANATRIKKWLLKSGRDLNFFQRHFFAISDQLAKVERFGILAEHTFSVGYGIGGRFSICGAISLSVMLSIGVENFQSFLRGAYLMDEHFKRSDLEKNIPVILALIGIWYQNFWGITSHLIFPYDATLSYFPMYLQQLSMESNGKSFDKSGHPIGYNTGPLVWGGTGTDVQHSYFQLLYQGTQRVHADFLCSIKPSHPFIDSHQELVAHFLSQSRAMMVGYTQEKNALNQSDTGHLYSVGNRPSNTLLYRELTPHVLGILVSLYEHKTFVQGVIWNINSFDQWGVETGKRHYRTMLPYVREDLEPPFDSSTQGLLRFYREHADKTT